jgi:hypothetical protein
VYTVKEKGGKPDRKPYPLPYGLMQGFWRLMYEQKREQVESAAAQHLHSTTQDPVLAQKPFITMDSGLLYVWNSGQLLAYKLKEIKQRLKNMFLCMLSVVN